MPRTRGYGSKYDFVKVKILLEGHYFVLSRFLIARMLTVTKIAPEDAVKASLELKKQLVDSNRLEVPQDEMEDLLFSIVRGFGYTEKHIERYRLVMRFHQQRVPLIVLICGTGGIGKSILATRLADRLNLPSVLTTDIVRELMYNASKYVLTFAIVLTVRSELDPQPIWGRPFVSKENTVESYKRESAIVRKGLEGDLQKAFQDGKPIIIEGVHLDLTLFSDLFAAARRTSMLDGEPGAPLDPAELVPRPDEPQDAPETPRSPAHSSVKATTHVPPLQTPSKKSKRRLHAVVVPFLLTLNEKDHRCLVENWISSMPHAAKLNLGPDSESQANALLKHFGAIEEYLIASGVPVTKVNVHRFEDTLDSLHRIVLDRIARAMSAVEKE